MANEQDILRIHSDFVVTLQGENLLIMIASFLKWHFFFFSLPATLWSKSELLFSFLKNTLIWNTDC